MSLKMLLFLHELPAVIKNLDDVEALEMAIIENVQRHDLDHPSLLECLKGNAYDQFYNEHIYVFSYTSLKELIKKI